MKTPRYLVSFDSGKLPTISTDILVVGSGIAGLRAAIEASKYGRVLLITKDTVSEGNTNYAQGGIASHINPTRQRGRLLAAHIKDTLTSGQGLSNPAMVRGIIKKGFNYIRELIDWGVQFDRQGGKFHLAQEGGHQVPRILHAGGDKTGAEILRVLLEKARQIINIELREKVFAVDLLTDKANRCLGLLAFQAVERKFLVIRSAKTILATGGAGQVYRETTNPAVATGDGIALAYRAGAILQDMEFVQFHPTALYVAGASRALISEAVRGAGGILRDKTGKRFMTDYHPLCELAPRDVVSRSIINQMRLTNDTSVYLDVTRLGAAAVKKRFPGLYHLCERFGIDITRDFIPVHPSAHYLIGGIRTRPDATTNLPNLFAVGECASSNFHGANRLGSNSLLEGLVMGAVAGLTAGKHLSHKPLPALDIKHQRPDSIIDLINIEDARNSLKSLMWRAVGVERNGKYLAEALRMIDFWDSYVLPKDFTEPAGWELQNMLILARLITHAARLRTESRGAHYRTDFPETKARWTKHITLSRDKI